MRSNDSLKVICVGISKTVDDAGLADLFSNYGGVADAKVVRDSATQASRGFGFVTFTAQSAMQRAIEEMDKKVVDGRTLNVRQLVPKDKFQAKKARAEEAGKPDGEARRPCWLLRKGKCTKGANCPYSHETKGGDFGSCFEFVQSGACKHGDKCKFYHPTPEEQAAAKDKAEQDATAAGKPSAKRATKEAPAKNNESAKSTQVDAVSAETKPRVCFAFQKGRCHRGKKCLYLHEKIDVPEAPKPIEAPSDSRKDGFEVVKHPDVIGKKRPRSESSASEVDEKEEDSDHDVEVKVKKSKAETTKESTSASKAPSKTNEKEGPAADATSPPKKVHEGEKPICRHFLRGKCKRGKICFFRHERPPSDDGDEPEDPTPLKALADHVAAFMANLGQNGPVAPCVTAPTAPAMPATVRVAIKEEPVKRKIKEVEVSTEQTVDEAPQRPAKKPRKQQQKVDMGAAFDGVSDDEDLKRPRQKVTKEQMKANREKLRKERRAKRLAKKEAVSRLRDQEEVELES